MTVRILLFVIGAIGFLVPITYASETEGTINNINRYAWSENLGWIDFGSSEGNITVTDTELTGHAYSESVGWIILNCSETSSCRDIDYKVANDSEGILSGYGWGENVGWVQFDPTGGGVTIDENGIFYGHAWNENTGWIIFNCAETSSCGDVNYFIETDWRPFRVRTTATPTVPTSHGSGRRVANATPIQNKQPVSVLNTVITRISNTIHNIAPLFVQKQTIPTGGSSNGSNQKTSETPHTIQGSTPITAPQEKYTDQGTMVVSEAHQPSPQKIPNNFLLPFIGFRYFGIHWISSFINWLL